MLKMGNPRSKTVIKGYIAVFVCLAVKAVHLEVVTSLTTDAFIAALRRFIARRGTPSTIYSDNGTNFKGAANHFQELHKLLQSSSHVEKVQDYLSKEKSEWKFVPPHCPHFGGLWEAAVKSMKHHLRRILGNNVCTYEELITITANIEACLNSRPLCKLPNDPSHFYLSPGHFLIGEPLTTLPSLDLTNVKSNRLSRWQQVQQQTQHFWQRWSADYLQELQRRPKWQHSAPNFHPGDTVLVMDDHTPPLQWPLAIVTAVHPGPDQRIRVVTVKTTKGTFQCPITKVCSLPSPNSML
jgi:hypothetical protein